MATQKQINANRLNAKKSRGPVSEAGKAVSSRNALKNGKYAKTEAARCAADIKELTAGFNAEYNPTTPEQRFLVLMLIHAQYQNRRYTRLETAIWERNRIEGGSEDENSLGAIFCRASKELDFVGRHIESANKRFFSALKQLSSLRAKGNNDPAWQTPMPAQFTVLKEVAPRRGGLFSVPKRG